MGTSNSPQSFFSKIQIFSWNINGMARKFWDFKGVIRLCDYPKIICLQETHSSHDLSLQWSSNVENYLLLL